MIITRLRRGASSSPCIYVCIRVVADDHQAPCSRPQEQVREAACATRALPYPLQRFPKFKDLQALDHHGRVAALYVLTLHLCDVGLQGRDEDGIVLAVLEVPCELVLGPGDHDGFTFEPQELKWVSEDFFIEPPVIQKRHAAPFQAQQWEAPARALT